MPSGKITGVYTPAPGKERACFPKALLGPGHLDTFKLKKISSMLSSYIFCILGENFMGFAFGKENIDLCYDFNQYSVCIRYLNNYYK